MGGRNSVPAEYNPHKKHLAVKGQEEYAWWTLDSIQRCADHAKREGLKVVNRRSFVEVFTDLTVIRQGKFLSLPLTVFDYFVDSDQKHVRRLRESDECGCLQSLTRFVLQAPPHTQKVKVQEVLAVLGLFCNGSPTAQLRFSFQLFDEDDSKTMTLVRTKRGRHMWHKNTSPHVGDRRKWLFSSR